MSEYQIGLQHFLWGNNVWVVFKILWLFYHLVGLIKFSNCIFFSPKFVACAINSLNEPWSNLCAEAACLIWSGSDECGNPRWHARWRKAGPGPFWSRYGSLICSFKKMTSHISILYRENRWSNNLEFNFTPCFSALLPTSFHMCCPKRWIGVEN